MNLKTFQAKTMAEALAKVKRHFGPDAVILHTRATTQGGFLGYGGEPLVEITASKDSFSLPGKPRGDTLRREPRPAAVEGAATAMPRTGNRSQTPGAHLLTLTNEVGALKSAVVALIKESRRARDPSLPESLQLVHQRLIEAQVAEEIADELVRKVRAELSDHELSDPGAVRVKLASYVESMLPIAGPARLVATGGPTIIALVGPTGVGKTTTVAKLAANYRLRHGRKVGLITIDTFRIAAIDQLQTYAKIIDVPLSVVVTPGEMRAALDAMRDRDVILIDTAGRSQKDEPKIAELKTLIDQAKPHEVHLVLSTTCNAAVLSQTIEHFSRLGVNRVILSKLDEAVGFGVILSCLKHAEARLSYVTTGQDVPDDIEVGRGARLAELILSGRLSKQASNTPQSSRPVSVGSD